MKKTLAAKLLLTAAAAAGILLAAGCGGSGDKKDEAQAGGAQKGALMQQIKERGKLVIGTASGFPPYEFIDTSKSEKTVAGIDINLAQKIADKLGVKLEVQDMNFSALLSSMAANKVDIVIAGITPTPEREKAVDFSDTYLSDKNIMLIRKSDLGKYTKVEDFYGKDIAAQKSTQQETLVKEYLKDAKIVSLDRIGDALMELQHGKVEGVPSQRAVAQQYLIMNPEIADSGVYFEGKDSAAAVAVPKGNEDFLQLINGIIKECHENGDFEKWTQECSELAVQNAQQK